jgi:hypothetical protein
MEGWFAPDVGPGAPKRNKSVALERNELPVEDLRFAYPD